MALQKPDIVIFDMDGTTVRHMDPRVLHVLEWLDDIAFKSSKFISWLFERKAQGPIIPDSEQKPKKPKLLVHRALHKVRRKPVEQIVEPCPGIYSVLSLLKKHDIPIGLASNGLGAGYGHDILEKFGLEMFFQATVFREDIQKSKPAPEAILLTLERMGVPLKESNVIWHIGDRHKDVTAAVEANKRTPYTIIPIACGLNASIAILEKGLSPENIIMSYQDMYARLQKLFSEPKS